MSSSQSHEVDWDLFNSLIGEPHKHLHIVDGAEYGLLLDGKFDRANCGVGEVMQEARAVQHLCDLAGIPEGEGDGAHIDARVYLLSARATQLREKLHAVAVGWCALEKLDEHAETRSGIPLLDDGVCAPCMRYVANLLRGETPQNVLHLRCPETQEWQRQVWNAQRIALEVSAECPPA